MKSEGFVTLRDALTGHGASDAPTLLIAGPVEDDCGTDPMFDQFPWRTHRVRNCLEVVLHLYGNHPRVVVCERDLPDGDWRDVLELTAAPLNPPPVTVTSRLSAAYPCAECLKL